MRFILALIPLAIVGCISPHNGDIAKDRAKVDNELGQEASLKEDRSQLSDLRKEIPADTQKSNDELALFLNLMKQGRENPQDVRGKFSNIVAKRRAAFRDKVQGLRDDYRKDETKRRESFMAEMKSKRDSFVKRKKNTKDTREFFAQQEKERTAYFADERERRQSFESEINAQSKDFDSYMRERQKEFDEQYRLYSKQFSERPKDKKAITGDEFKRLDETPASPLGTEQ